jgi:hypothetical protein
VNHPDDDREAKRIECFLYSFANRPSGRRFDVELTARREYTMFGIETSRCHLTKMVFTFDVKR